MTASVVTTVCITLAFLVLNGNVQTGFSGKTIWDWLQVVGIPVTAVILSGGFAIAVQKAGQRGEAQRELAADLAREGTLRDFLDRMSDLMLNHGLQKSLEDSPARAVAQARTLGALRSLDGTRKGALI